MAHDFKKFPELTNAQMSLYYFESPHKQIFEDFDATVVKVIDGDTIRVKTDFRDFEFKVRFANVAAAELSEQGGFASRDWLKKRIEGKDVRIEIDLENRVGKWGRIIGEVIEGGFNVNEESVRMGRSIEWDLRNSSPLIDFNKQLEGLIPA